MKRNIISCLPGIFLFFVTTLVFGQIDTDDAVYQELNKSYLLNADGSIDYRYTKTLKLLSYNAFHRLFGETFIVYNPNYQKLIIHEAYTIMADGKKIVVPENGFNEVLPRYSDKAPAFNQLREMIISHTGLEIGATIHVDYTIQTQHGFYPALMGTEQFVESQPVNTFTVTVSLPENQTLYYHLFSSTLKPVITKQDGMIFYQWRENNIPAISQERNQVKNGEERPVLVFSTDNGYDQIASFFAKQPAFTFEKSLQLNQVITRLINNEMPKKEMIFRLQEIVVNELNLFDIPELYTGYQCRTPEKVWLSNGGTVSEKALLLATLLREAGVEANPALVVQRRLFDRNIGNLTSIETWMVRVVIPEMGETYLSIDQINAYSPRAFLPDQVFLVYRDKEPFRVVLPEEALSTIDLKGTLVITDSFLLTGSMTGELTGLANPYLALSRKEDKLKHYFSGGIDAHDIRDLTVSVISPKETLFSCNVKNDLTSTIDTGYLFFALPMISVGVERWGIHYLESTRHVPLSVSFPVKEEYAFTLAIPANIVLLSDERDIHVSNEAGTFHFMVHRKDNMVHVKKYIEIPRALINVQQYSQFKALMDQWNLPQNRELLFSR